MVSFEFLAIIVSVLGLAASITYYAIILSNANKTRKAQLFMSLQQRFDNPQLMGALIQSRDYTDLSFEEWYEKYGPNTNREVYTDWVCLQNAIQGIGLLVESKQVDAKMESNLMGSIITLNWERSGPIIIGMRKRLGREEVWNQVEELNTLLLSLDNR